MTAGMFVAGVVHKVKSKGFCSAAVSCARRRNKWCVLRLQQFRSTGLKYSRIQFKMSIWFQIQWNMLFIFLQNCHTFFPVLWRECLHKLALTMSSCLWVKKSVFHYTVLLLCEPLHKKKERCSCDQKRRNIPVVWKVCSSFVSSWLCLLLLDVCYVCCC